MYGKEALIGLGLWKAVEPRLARTKYARAALASVERGEAIPGVVYSTDAAISKKVRVELHRELAVPILYVSRSVGEVLRLAETVVILDSGRVSAIGKPADLISSPYVLPFTGQFCQSEPSERSLDPG
jgi:ABC-type antimicrobial peptide transport system ATPase subunit